MQNDILFNEQEQISNRPNKKDEKSFKEKFKENFLVFLIVCPIGILLFLPFVFFKDKAFLFYIGIFLGLFLLALVICFFKEIFAILLVAAITIGLAFLLNSFLGTLTIPAILLSIALIILFKPLRNN